jgi:hypothetical protein
MSDDPEEPTTYSYKYKVTPPKSEKAFVIPEHTFVKIKNRLANHQSVVPIYQNLGSLLLGIAGSAIITAYTLDNIVCWAISLITLIGGILLWIFSYILFKVESKYNDELITDLSFFE